MNLFFLYCVKVIHENFGTLVEFCLEPKHGSILKDTILKLLDDLSDVSVQIIDAIAVPDELLGSTLGNQDGQVYRAIIDAVEWEETCYKPAEWIPLLQKVKSNGKKMRESKL